MWHSDQTCLFWISQLSQPTIHDLWLFPWEWSFNKKKSDQVKTNQNAGIYLRTILPHDLSTHYLYTLILPCLNLWVFHFDNAVVAWNVALSLVIWSLSPKGTDWLLQMATSGLEWDDSSLQLFTLRYSDHMFKFFRTLQKFFW